MKQEYIFIRPRDPSFYRLVNYPHLLKFSWAGNLTQLYQPGSNFQSASLGGKSIHSSPLAGDLNSVGGGRIPQLACLSPSRVEWDAQTVQEVLDCICGRPCARPLSQRSSFYGKSAASGPVRFPYRWLLHAHILELLYIHARSRNANIKGREQ